MRLFLITLHIAAHWTLIPLNWRLKAAIWASRRAKNQQQKEEHAKGRN